MTAAISRSCPGTVVLIGGAEDKTGPAQVLRSVLRLTRVGRPLVAVCASASTDPAERLVTYEAAFGRLGADTVDITAPTPDEAHDPQLARRARAADVVFFTGGSQNRLVAALSGTPLAQAVTGAAARGTVLAGTSAGAAAASAVMIAGGDGRQVALATGLGWLPGVVVDQHFTQRGRLPRLAGALAQCPEPLTGLGVDEDTAAFITAGTVGVVGTGAVTVVRPGRAAERLHHRDRARVPALASRTALAA